MASKPPHKTPPTVRERTQNFLLYGFIISIVLHLLAGPLIKFQRTPEAPEKVETVKIDKMPTPPPTPKPTPPPTPKPTPKPTPPPTPPPHQTPQPPKPKEIKINTLKTNAHSGGPSEQANTHTQGSTSGVPNGSPSGAPSAPPPPPTAAPTAPPPTPAPTPTPPQCPQPNVAAKTVNAVSPDTPPIAAQQGITGDVRVRVALDDTSKLVSATIDKSPSALLNNAALTAARGSKFQTQIVNCKPVAAEYIFIVSFTSQ